MTLVEHLYELRYRLAVSLLTVAGTTVLGFLWFEHGPLGMPSLGDVLTRPYCELPPTVRLTLGPDGECRLLATAPFEAFLLQFKVAVAAGVVLGSPIWLYQIWAFITPGLYENERRFALTFAGFAAVLFVGGAVLAYYVVGEGLSFLLGFAEGQIITALTGEKYISFILAMLIIFGVSFELPLLVVMLNRAGVLSYQRLSGWRRGIIFGLFVFAAVATPGQDPFSMVALALALTLLFEVAAQVARIHDRRKARKRAAEGWDSWSDDEASPLPPVEAEDPGPAPGRKADQYGDVT